MPLPARSRRITDGLRVQPPQGHPGEAKNSSWRGARAAAQAARRGGSEARRGGRRARSYYGSLLRGRRRVDADGAAALRRVKVGRAARAAAALFLDGFSERGLPPRKWW